MQRVIVILSSTDQPMQERHCLLQSIWSDCVGHIMGEMN